MYDALLQALGFAGNVLDTPGSVARGLGSAGVRGVRRLLGDEDEITLAIAEILPKRQKGAKHGFAT